MANHWIEHVKNVAAQKKITYTEALKVAGETYKKQPQSTGSNKQVDKRSSKSKSKRSKKSGKSKSKKSGKGKNNN